jgi:triacylglycerol lipase
MIAKVPATSSAAQRAEILLTAIEEKFPGREVNLVGHSMVNRSRRIVSSLG